MDWLTVALILAVLVGAAAGTAIVVRSPTFWLGLGNAIVKSAMPAILAVVLKRMPPEEEKAWRDCQRRGGKWNHRKRRCE